MTVKVVKPIKITEAVLTASSIPEPDASVGEVAFNASSRDIKVSMQSASVETYGTACIFGDFSSIDAKIIVPTSSTDTESADSNSFYAIARDLSGNKSGGVWFSAFSTSAYNSVARASATVISYTGISKGTDGLDSGDLYYVESQPGNLFPLNISSARKISVASALSNSTRALCSGHVSSTSFACALDLESQDASQKFKIIQINKSSGAQEFNGSVAFPDPSYQSICSVFEYNSNPAIAFSGSGGIKVYSYTSGFGSEGTLEYSVDFIGSLSSSEISSYTQKSFKSVGVDLSNFEIISLPETGGSAVYGYQPGERAILTSTHKLYQCVKATNIRPDLGATGDENETWVEVGATNKFASFDERLSYPAQITGTKSFELTLADRVNTVAFLNISGITSVRVQMEVGGSIVYDSTKDGLDTSLIYDHYTWWFSDAEYVNELIFDDLPPYPTSKLIIDVTGEGELGQIVTGFAKEIGVCLAESSSNTIDLSTQEFDAFGNQKYVPRPIIKLNKYEILSDKSIAPAVERLFREISGTNALWIGDIGSGQLLTTYGYTERSPLPYNMPDAINYSTTIRGSA